MVTGPLPTICLYLISGIQRIGQAGKMQSRHLQLADICAFVIRGHLAKHPHNPPLYSKLRPMMAVYPKTDDE